MRDFSTLMTYFNDRIDAPQIAAFAPFWTHQSTQPGFMANARWVRAWSVTTERTAWS